MMRTVTRSLRRTAPALLLCVLAGSACASGEAKQEAARQDQAAAEADALGREIFDLIDRTVAYQSSHRGRLPRRLRDVGIDSLTSTTMRWLEVRGRSPRITVGYRRTANHALRLCSGSEQVLEEYALAGSYEIACTLRDGSQESFRVPSGQ